LQTKVVGDVIGDDRFLNDNHEPVWGFWRRAVWQQKRLPKKLEICGATSQIHFSSMEVLRKVYSDLDTAYLAPPARGPEASVDTGGGKTILYKLKTGCQWRQLPLKQFFFLPTWPLSLGGVYYHFRGRRTALGSTGWLHAAGVHRPRLDLSSIQLDGSHTRTRSSGRLSAIKAQARTTNLLFWPIIPAGCQRTPQAKGNHHDYLTSKKYLRQLCTLLEEAHIPPGRDYF
jgi:hypothetical protein